MTDKRRELNRQRYKNILKSLVNERKEQMKLLAETEDLDTYLQRIHKAGMTYAQAQIEETCMMYQHFERKVW